MKVTTTFNTKPNSIVNLGLFLAHHPKIQKTGKIHFVNINRKQPAAHILQLK